MAIGPSTVATGFDTEVTEIEQHKKVFKNPRGLGYYYALFRDERDVNSQIFGSLDGLSWEFIRTLVASRFATLWICEDDAGSRLLVYVIAFAVYPEYVKIWGFEIRDTESHVRVLFDYKTVAIRTDDGVYNPSVCLDSSGYIWVTWTDEFTNKGKQRNKLRATRSTTPYPVTTPSWETIVDVYGEKGSTDYPDGISCNSGPFLRSELVPLTAEADVGVVFSYKDYTAPATKLKACTLNYSAGIQEGTMVALDDTVHDDLLHSSVAESGGTSDVFIGYKDSGGEFDCLKWDVSLASSAAFGTVFASAVNSLVIAIDKNATPDKLYCFYVKNADNTDFHYNITEVDAFSLEGETEVDDGAAEALDYLSASYQDWDLDGDVQIIYTRQTNKTVRFWAVGVAAVYEASTRLIGTVIAPYSAQVRNIGNIVFPYSSRARLIGTVVLPYIAQVRNIGSVYRSYSAQVRTIGLVYRSFSTHVRLIGSVYRSYSARARLIGTIILPYSSLVRNMGVVYRSFSAQVRNIGILTVRVVGKCHAELSVIRRRIF